MSEEISKNTLSSVWFSRALIILILVALLVPHSLGFSRSSSRDMAFYSFSLFALCWTLVRQDSYVFTDHSSSTFLQFSSGDALFQYFVILPLFLIVIYTQSRFLRGVTSRNLALLVIVIALGIQVFLVGTNTFIYIYDGFAVYGSYPFPVFYILSLVSVFWKREPKSIEPERP